MKVLKAAGFLILMTFIHSCARDKCVVCLDYDGNETGLKCFKTTEQALEWQAEQRSIYPNKPLDCNK